MERLYDRTLGARDFSCAVSGFGQVLKVTRAKTFAAGVFGRTPKTCRPAVDEALRYTREKISGTQGITTVT